MNGLWEADPHDTPCISFFAHCWGSLPPSIAAPVCNSCFPSSPMDKPGYHTKDNIVRESDLLASWQDFGKFVEMPLPESFRLYYLFYSIYMPLISPGGDSRLDFSSLHWNTKLMICQTGIPFGVHAHMYKRMFVCVCVWDYNRKSTWGMNVKWGKRERRGPLPDLLGKLAWFLMNNKL